MPVDTLVVKYISAEEESAINTAAAMAAAVTFQLENVIHPRLAALEMAFRGYSGVWACDFGSAFTLTWNGNVFLAEKKPKSPLLDLPAGQRLLADCDPILKIEVSLNVEDICKDFTKYLNSLVGMEKQTDGDEAV